MATGSHASDTERERRRGTFAWATASLGRQVFVMLAVALLLGAASVVGFSQVFLQAWLPWEAVSQANQASMEAAAAAAEAVGTQGEAAAQAKAQTAAAAATATEASAQEAVRTGLLVVAGLGGVFGLVVAYRRQKTLEEQEGPRQRTRLMTERFREAATQLGSAAPATRLAGVYAMATVADEWDEQQQQCIDVLCAYLRLPYRPPVRRARRAHGRRQAGDPFPGGAEDSVLAERQVRTTVVRVIRDHLQPGATHSWEGRNFTFTGAHFDEADFSFARFSGGTVDFFGAQFSGGTVDFFGAQFTGGTVRFVGAKFTGGTVSFVGAKFTGGTVSFVGAKFSGGNVWFASTLGPTITKFAGSTVDFSDTEFTGGTVTFAGAEFTGGTVTFVSATFAGSGVYFASEISAGTTTFSGGTVSFRSAWFSGGTVSFGRARFSESDDRGTMFVHPDGSEHRRPPDLSGAA